MITIPHASTDHPEAVSLRLFKGIIWVYFGLSTLKKTNYAFRYLLSKVPLIDSCLALKETDLGCFFEDLSL